LPHKEAPRCLSISLSLSETTPDKRENEEGRCRFDKRKERGKVTCFKPKESHHHHHSDGIHVMMQVKPHNATLCFQVSTLNSISTML
jgi:hypothetical protein